MLKKALIRPLLIIAAFICGAIFPKLGEATFVIRYFLIVMLYFIYLPLDVKTLKLHKSQFVLTGANILIGVAAWYIAGLSGDKSLADAAFFAAITPTASAAPVIMKFLGGNVSYIITGFVVTNTLVSTALFFMLPLMITGEVNPAGFLNAAVNLVVLIGSPAILAFITRKIYPSSVEWAKKCGNLSFILWVILLCVISGSAMKFFYSHPGISYKYYFVIAGISLLICAVNFSLGYLIGGREFAREASQTLGQKNTTFTIVLASTFSSPLAAMGPTFYVLWHNLWNALQLFIHDRKMAKKAAIELDNKTNQP